MKIGIIVAMQKELELLNPMLAGHTRQEHDGTVFHCGNIGHHSVVAMQCGIGKVNAAIGTAALIDGFSPDVVINTGVAGGASKSVNVMDVVVGQRVAYHDVWCGFDSTWGQIQGMPLFFDGKPELVEALQGQPGVHCGLICSGDRFIDSIGEVEAIQSRFPDVLAVDMESAAIAHTCFAKHTPFLSLRVISDSPGASHNNSAQYTDFWADAPKRTFEKLQQLINGMI